MQVFRRAGSVVHICAFSAVVNVALLYAFFFITDEVIRRLGTFERGIFCVDPSIQYNMKKSTVTSLQHRVYNISLMVISVFIVEAFRQRTGASGSVNLSYRVGSIQVPKYIVTVLTFVGYSQVGYIMNELLVKFVKGFIGRPRPYFWAVCKPEPIPACESLNPNVYLEPSEYTCTGEADEVHEARKSFYSGHSCVTMYCAFWTVLYLQARLKPALRNNVVVAILQTLLMTGGLYICCSRIADNKHHWGDVAVGIIVGMGFASFGAKFWSKLFKKVEVGEDAEDYSTTEKDQEKETV